MGSLRSSHKGILSDSIIYAAFFAFHHFFFALRIFSIASGDILRLGAVAFCSRCRRFL